MAGLVGATLQLVDGRTLAYAENGDLHGKPVFLFHGTPGSRFFRPPDEITQKLGVRLITVDRPGYGLSNFQPGRRILDWPADIAQLADHLRLPRFAVAGHSGGGPYVMACAAALPGGVSAAALVAAAGPVDTPVAAQGMSLVNRLGFNFGRYIPWPFFRLLIWAIYHKRRDDPAAALDHDIGRRPEADDLQLLQPGIRAVCIESEKEAFRPGMRGFAWDAHLITRDWGFKLDEIQIPITIWHGTEDDLTSTSMARYMADQIPGAHLRLCENEAHLLLFPHWEEILNTLINHTS